jgi:hypothetical protein
MAEGNCDIERVKDASWRKREDGVWIKEAKPF